MHWMRNSVEPKRAWAWTALIVALTGLYTTLWLPKDLRLLSGILTTYWMILTLIDWPAWRLAKKRGGDAIRTLGWKEFKRYGFWATNLRSLCEPLLVGLAVATIIMLVGYERNSLNQKELADFTGGVERYWQKGTGEQILLLTYFFVQLERAWNPRWNKHLLNVCLGLMFSFAHLPNPFLMLVCFPGGLFSGWYFQKCRNVFVIALAHALIGQAILTSVPHPNMTVGYYYHTNAKQVRNK